MGGNADLSRRVAARYRGFSRFDRRYVALKLRHDPVYADLLALGGRNRLGRVVDVGCGRGQLGILLLEAGYATSVLGLDWNAAQLRQARQAAAGLAFEVLQQDLAANQAVPVADTVAIVDVLYQLDTGAQNRLLNMAARAAGRQILVRTVDPARGLRSIATRVLEVLGRRFWPNAGAHVNPQALGMIVAILESNGFAVDVAPCSRGTPFANVLLVCERVGMQGKCVADGASRSPATADSPTFANPAAAGPVAEAP